MKDNMKDNILNTGGDPPATEGVDFSKMPDEELMKMDISDIFLEDLDRFLAEKEVRLSRRERMEARAEELNESINALSAADDMARSSEPVVSNDSIEDAGAAETSDAEEDGQAETGDEPALENQMTEDVEPAKSAEPSEEAASQEEAEPQEDAAPTEDAAPQEDAAPTEEAASQEEAESAEEAESTEEAASSENAESTEIGQAEAADSSVSEDQPAVGNEPAKGTEPEVSPASAENVESVAADAAQSEAAPVQGGPGYVLPPPAPATPAPVTPAATAPEQKKKPGIAALIFVGSLLCCAIIAIAAAYFYYADYFSKRFFPGTIINERDVSVLEPAQVKQDIANDVVTYRLDIKELNDVKETITSEDIALAYVDDGAVDKILKEQDTKLWFLSLFGTKTYEVSTGTTYDREKAEQVVNGLACLNPENITAPADAQLVDNGTSFSIQPEVEGNQLDEEKFRTMVFDALDSGETEIDVVKDDCYLHPSVRSDNENLNTRMNEYNAILGVNVYYVFGENTEYVNADTLRPFITDDGNHVTLADDYARKLVYGWGQKYDTFGLAREFTTHSGEVIMLPDGGDYGWVINKDATIADVQDAVTTQAAGERTPTFLYSAMGWDNGDITGTYVEVSISEQHLWCYHNYELVMDTDVVTGLPSAERETRRGIYAIDAKKEHATLGRLDVQGYASPVDYWAPFDGGRGLHDAPWRGSFGGDIYTYDGSHGCVNIPSQNMAAIYNAIEIGNAVIIY